MVLATSMCHGWLARSMIACPQRTKAQEMRRVHLHPMEPVSAPDKKLPGMVAMLMMLTGRIYNVKKAAKEMFFQTIRTEP